jgi:plastocyanin
MRSTDVLAALAVLLTATPAVAGAGAVKGTIMSGHGPTVPASDAVVMIEGPSIPAPADAPHGVMDQRRETFVPHVLAIRVGTAVDFPNSDRALHNVFSVSPTKKFDLGMYDVGERKSVTFDLPGVVTVRCNVHPKMEGFIVVHTNPYLAVSDAEGGYTIGDVPPGSYTVRVWHESLGTKDVPVTVREGQVAPVNVVLNADR